MTDRQRLLRILGYLFVHRWMFVAGILCTVLFGLTETGIPWLMYLLFDADKAAAWVEPADLPFVLPLLLVTLFIIRGILGFLRGYWRAWLQYTMSRDIRRDMVHKLVALPKVYHDQESSGVLISRVMQFVDEMIGSTADAIITLFQDVARLSGYLATMFIISWKYTLIILVTLPFTLLIIAVLIRRVRRFADLRVSALSDLTGALSDTIQGQIVVKSYGGQEREKGKLEKKLARVRAWGLRQGVANALNVPLSQLLIALALSVVFANLAHDLTAGTMTEGEISAFIFAMALLPLPLRNLARIAAKMQRSLAASDKVFALIDAETEKADGTYVPSSVRGTLELRQICFKYSPDDPNWVLDHLDLSIAVGETVALVGPSGGGKTTVTSLLMGYYQPDAGTITLDDTDLRDWSLVALRANIAVVSQDVILFDTTVAENVAYPAVGADIDRDKLHAALQSAQAQDMVAALPQQENTMLGERGLRLSGGERQRLSIARAFYRNAPLLVMDEATSSLDSRTEDAIKEALRELLRGRTAIIIAHRFATVEIADRVIVIDRGHVIAQGDHPTLMRTSGLYRTLYEAQQLEH